MGAAPALAGTPEAVKKTCANIALPSYQDPLTTARALGSATDALITAPIESTLLAAQAAILRIPTCSATDLGGSAMDPEAPDIAKPKRAPF